MRLQPPRAGRGADVILVSGPTALKPPAGVEVVHVTTAAEMHQAVMKEAGTAAVVIMAAAVADYAPDAAADAEDSQGSGHDDADAGPHARYHW
jgi:phosphopantothenoylcysteine decarboxylase/phosphopantothenate--cysteine ligase